MIRPDAKTKLYFLIGKPVDHSISPQIYNNAFSALKINSTYVASHVEESNLPAALDGIRALSVAGANVTSPYKEAVIPFLDSISPEALIIKSVNTIFNHNGQLHGESTDGEGFYRSLKESAPGYDPDQGLMIIGAGGAARAAAYAMARHGATKHYIVNRTPDRGLFLAALLSKVPAVLTSDYLPLEEPVIKQALEKARVVIYSLSVDNPEFIKAVSSPGTSCAGKLLFDLRYHPSRTLVMSAFEKSGGQAFNGLGMLFWQAVLAFELFSGEKAPLTVMRSAAKIKKAGEAGYDRI